MYQKHCPSQLLLLNAIGFHEPWEARRPSSVPRAVLLHGADRPPGDANDDPSAVGHPGKRSLCQPGSRSSRGGRGQVQYHDCDTVKCWSWVFLLRIFWNNVIWDCVSTFSFLDLPDPTLVVSFANLSFSYILHITSLYPFLLHFNSFPLRVPF